MNEHERGENVALATAGDQDALQRLIIEYHDALSGTLQKNMDALLQRVIDLDDVLQEAYAAAFQRVGGCRFEGPGAFYGWLETIALNKLKDEQRAQRSRKRDAGRVLSAAHASRPSYADLIHRLSSPDSTPSHRVAKSEAVAAVISSLAQLTAEQREVVRLRFLEEKSVAEVAARMKKSEAAIHMLCHRALKALRELLDSITHYLSHL